MEGLTRLGVSADALAEICRRHHVRRLCAFGSILRPDFTPQSDVDLLVEFEPGRTPGLAFVDLQEDLSEVLGRPVDLVTRQGLNRFIRDQVLSAAREIYVAA